MTHEIPLSASVSGDSVSSTGAKGELPGHTPHSPHLEKSAERILRVSFRLGTHRSLSEQKSRRGYCWRGGERKQRKERGRGQEVPALAAAGTQEGLEGPGGFSPSLAPFHSGAGSRGTLGFSRLLGKLLQQGQPLFLADCSPSSGNPL